MKVMQTKKLLQCLKTQIAQGIAPFEKEIVLRIAGRDYAVRSIDTSTAPMIFEAGEEIIHDDTLAGASGAVPRAELSQETAATDAFAQAVPEATTDVTANRQSPQQKK
jgi:hypothetical protein